MSFVGCIPRFIREHATWILTGMGLTGLAGTAVAAAKAAPKAKNALIWAESVKYAKDIHEKFDMIPGDLDPEELDRRRDEVVEEANRNPPKLTMMEKIKVAGPYYIPTVLIGATTMGCIVGAQVLNVRQQAVILSAYGMLAAQYDAYRNAIRDEYGEEADRKALTEALNETRKLRAENERLKMESGPRRYGIATLPGVIWEAKPLAVQEAFSHWNRNLILGGENDLAQLYDFLGIPKEYYDLVKAEEFGWNEYENEVDYGINYIDFQTIKIETECGTVNMIVSCIPPYRLGLDYGFQGTIEDNILDGYDVKEAISQAYEVRPEAVIAARNVNIVAPNEYFLR